jgi:hypothetical protein
LDELQLINEVSGHMEGEWLIKWDPTINAQTEFLQRAAFPPKSKITSSSKIMLYLTAQHTRFKRPQSRKASKSQDQESQVRGGEELWR